MENPWKENDSETEYIQMNGQEVFRFAVKKVPECIRQVTEKMCIRDRVKAEKYGCSQVLWLDGRERKYVEEVGAMNIMFKIDGEIYTAPIEGTVLPGVTRDSIIHILKDWGYKVNETHLSVDDLMQAGRDGRLEEVYGTGTAAVISPVGALVYKGEEITINNFQIGELTQKLYDYLTGIQWGKVEDKYGWTRLVK